MGNTPGRNEAEARFRATAERNRWGCTKRGWPDFFCCNERGPFVVEVKRVLKDGGMAMLRRDQVMVLNWLRGLGVRCFVSDGITLEPYNPRVHAPAIRRHVRRNENGEVS